MNRSKTFFVPILLSLLLLGLGSPVMSENRMVYEVMEPQGRNKLPLAPHVLRLRARPTELMIQESQATPVRFMVLDKRTLQVFNLETMVGDRKEMPWGGWLKPVAFAPDLIIKDGQSLHGLEGHVNPAVWIQLEDKQGKIMHEGWLFVRDTAQTAWDHPRFDLTFIGVVPKLVVDTPPSGSGGKPAAGGKGGSKATPSKSETTPKLVTPPKPADEVIPSRVGSKPAANLPIPPKPSSGSATGVTLPRVGVSESSVPPPPSRGN